MQRLILAGFLSVCSVLAHADLIDTIKARGTLVAGVSADVPPFGQRNKNHTVSGYDVDFAAAIAKKLGVKLVVQDVDPAERIPSVKSGKVDVIVAAFTKTPEREREVACSIGYFVAAQKALNKKGKYPSPESLAKLRIAVSSGTTGEELSKKLYPKAQITAFSDISNAVRSLEQGGVDVVMDDEPTLAGALNIMTTKAQYEISSYSNAIEILSIAVKLNEKRLLNLVNETLLETEKTGEAELIFNRWFGPQSNTPFPRTFRIQG
ncbi:transporter substrate-binding domain-containing protein [Iodobacter fluviatilis]|uniref:Amino acid ABC transporter substrate-binding protein n=1 Tax=Iodobacter fluviatilis TaxID=537 RepID=A0A7G3GAS0_9NEIS|nr:transporter substrate-binding domain-containing protein [Iodobacter fluviatilis]QBC44163.1 amino acid ABC transporter substrate-binding protein [Iodobacter fluviatilis]